jgi:hypothetical protein
MKSIVKIMFLVVLLVGSANAFDRKPLVNISFNNPQVEYQKSLGYAAKQALKVKQDVIFDVVAYGPNSAFYGNQVANDLVKMGVSQNNVTLTGGQPTPNNAVLIFVR